MDLSVLKINEFVTLEFRNSYSFKDCVVLIDRLNGIIHFKEWGKRYFNGRLDLFSETPFDVVDHELCVEETMEENEASEVNGVPIKKMKGSK